MSRDRRNGGIQQSQGNFGEQVWKQINCLRSDDVQTEKRKPNKASQRDSGVIWQFKLVLVYHHLKRNGMFTKNWHAKHDIRHSGSPTQVSPIAMEETSTRETTPTWHVAENRTAVHPSDQRAGRSQRPNYGYQQANEKKKKTKKKNLLLQILVKTTAEFATSHIDYSAMKSLSIDASKSWLGSGKWP